MKVIIVYVSVPNKKEADRIAQALLTDKLAACVTIVPGISSRYWWKGKIETAREVLLIIKTMPSRYKALEKRVCALHSYDVPEILAIPVVLGNRDYMAWMDRSLNVIPRGHRPSPSIFKGCDDHLDNAQALCLGPCFLPETGSGGQQNDWH